MSFSLREKVAEGRMRGGLISFGSSPPHPILLPERRGSLPAFFSRSQKRKSLLRRWLATLLLWRSSLWPPPSA